MKDVPVATVEQTLHAERMNWDIHDGLLVTAESYSSEIIARHRPDYSTLYGDPVDRVVVRPGSAVRNITVEVPNGATMPAHIVGIRLKITVEVIAEVADED